MLELQESRMSAGFTTTSLRSGMLPMGHILSVDHFKMALPTFPPHPHAGFSAVTYMLPWSQGAFINRDSLGDRSIIAPGDLHWTLAGAGMMHEEIPENPGTDCEGLQIFVKLREGNELAQPRAFHIAAASFPAFSATGLSARVLVGSWHGVQSPIPEQENTTMLHLSVTGQSEIELPAARDAFAFVLRGRGEINGAQVTAGVATGLTKGVCRFSGENLEVLLGLSDVMPQVPHFSGPFCMFDTRELENARRRFASGGMGQLSSSF